MARATRHALAAAVAVGCVGGLLGAVGWITPLCSAAGVVAVFLTRRPGTAAAADWLDAAAGRPQTFGTYARVGPGPGGVLAAAATAATADSAFTPRVLDGRVIACGFALITLVVAPHAGRVALPRPSDATPAFAAAGSTVGVGVSRPNQQAAHRPAAAAAPTARPRTVPLPVASPDPAAVPAAGRSARTSPVSNVGSPDAAAGVASDSGTDDADTPPAASRGNRPAVAPARVPPGAARLGSDLADVPPPLRPIARRYFADRDD